jgi:acyl carrier protein
MKSIAVSPRELAALFIQSLNLEDVEPDTVDISAPLFGSGLDLDSLDMLEIALVVQQHFGVKLKADDPNVETIFGSLQNLADYINSLHSTAG